MAAREADRHDASAADAPTAPPPVDLTPAPPIAALLPPALASFLVVADTHLVDDRAAHAHEFGSRLKQNARVAAALRAATSAGLPVMHLGDLVQDYPESPLHEDLLARAAHQWRATGAQLRFTAGNTDVGDKRDPTSPAAPASPATIERFARVVGAPWTASELGPLRALTVTASLFNSGLSLEDEQWAWLESQLAQASGRRIVLFFHYPLFLRSPLDPDVGNYDVVNEPARSRLIQLIERFGVEAVFTGHSHFHFLNRIGATRAYGVPSTSFTRPGFSELFSSAPPPDRGRDDVPKLGFLLATVHDDGIRVHQVRTGSIAASPDATTARPVVTGVPLDLPSSRLGVILRHPVATLAETPDTFPSVIRQPMRNDYPLLACLELGARVASVSAADADDPVLAARLAVLRDEGVRVVARVVWTAVRAPRLPAPGAPVDEIELVLVNRPAPTATEFGELTEALGGRDLIVSTMARRVKGGAELPRWQYGFTTDDIPELDRDLRTAGLDDSRVLVSVRDVDDVHVAGEFAATSSLTAITAVDLVAQVEGPDAEAAGNLAELFLASCERPSGRFLVDGLSELDRTLDLSAGLLDRAWNPRPAFHTLRILNSLVHGGTDGIVTRQGDGFRVRRTGVDGLVRLGRLGADAASEDAEIVVDLCRGVAVADRPEGPTLLLLPEGASTPR